ncbi:MAG TPA: type II CAAX endopeptidase family protein [Thermoanaerobaculia bacterium]|nr:type II CAAX endopeptidase family protein [Thermoanaerobaculia bacterium]
MITVALVLALVWLAIIAANERFGIFRCDRFPNIFAKIFGYLWLGLFLIVVGVLTAYNAVHPPTAQQLEQMPFIGFFVLHFVMIVFLLVWWLITRRPPLGTFLNIPRNGNGEAVMTGFAVGFGGWIATIVIALFALAILRVAGLVPDNIKPPAMIAFMAHVPWWKKASIVFAAMTVEEAFFRGFLQKRLGLIASTMLFAVAHAGYGQPLLLVGVSIISLIIGTVFYRTKNLLPGIIAHGVFDAIQLFVIIPIAFRFAGLG